MALFSSYVLGLQLFLLSSSFGISCAHLFISIIINIRKRVFLERESRSHYMINILK
uniref:Uncharacterized protein n=1 Tax=Lepeophtheirus salmonis TaxID=72036 RepID=A0A0K2UX31_LEPSM